MSTHTPFPMIKASIFDRSKEPESLTGVNFTLGPFQFYVQPKNRTILLTKSSSLSLGRILPKGTIRRELKVRSQMIGLLCATDSRAIHIFESVNVTRRCYVTESYPPFEWRENIICGSRDEILRPK